MKVKKLCFLFILLGFWGCNKDKITNAQNNQQSVNQKPTLVKLPFAFSQDRRTPMETTPVVFNSRLLLVANYRPSGPTSAEDKNSFLYIDDLETGKEITRFGMAHSFVSAIVNGDDLHVFALDFSDSGEVWKSNGINHFISNDLENWRKEKVILPEGDELLFNTSVCRDDKGFLMAYESNVPVKFCFKFARSNDLSKWEKIPDLVFTGEHNEYSACPVIRYCKPYYYVIYLHAPIPDHKGWISYLARSKDLNIWELSPFNPVLEAEGGEGINNSDVDILEYKEKTYLFYATGDQASWGTVRVAMFDGPLKEFFESHFPNDTKFTKVSAIK
jgi:hypothetical protein